MDSTRTMRTFPPLNVDGGLLHIDREMPVAAFEAGGRFSYFEWGNALVPAVSFSAELYPVADGAWVTYTANSSLAWYPDGVQNTAAFLSSTGIRSSVGLGGNHAVGADAFGLWTTTFDTRFISDYLGGELPEGWTRPRYLIRHNVDGRTTALTVDRPVAGVTTQEDGIRITFSPSPPIAIPESHGSTRFAYPLESIDIPGHVLAAGQVSVHDFQRSRVTDDLYGVGYVERLRHDLASAREIERHPLPDHVSAEWELVDAEYVDVRAVEDRAIAQFSYMGSSGQADRVYDPVRNLECSLEGEWPHTKLIITFDDFRHPRFRFRRTINLFEQGGRVALSEYAEVHFTEDIHTNRFEIPGSDVELVDF